VVQLDDMISKDYHWKDYHWKDLLIAIENKKCVPFIGAGASAQWLPLGTEISLKWAMEYDYPLEDSGQLPRVTEFLKVSDIFPGPHDLLNTELKKINPPNFSLEEFRKSPYAVLADLNLPIYITTNYDQFLEAALRSRGRNPTSTFCEWHESLQRYDADDDDEAFKANSILKDRSYRPQENEPLVFHLHGVINTPVSMVLTEYDYIEFIVSLIEDERGRVLPPIIQRALALGTLLFIGYRLEDINFRVIFQKYLRPYSHMKQTKQHFGVLLPPKFTEDKKQKAQEYLDIRAKRLFNADIYWGEFSGAA
jgi:hypothetical protein